MQTIEKMDVASRVTLENAKSSAIASKDRFLRTFSFVPDDKLNWQPTPTGRSALQVAAHIGLGTESVEPWLRGIPLADTTVEEFFEDLKRKELQIRTRQEAIDLIESATAAACRALDAMTPEQIEGEIKTPFGMFPAKMFVGLLAAHFTMHGGQIDYLQTLWGDLDPHMG